MKKKNFLGLIVACFCMFSCTKEQPYKMVFANKVNEDTIITNPTKELMPSQKVFLNLISEKPIEEEMLVGTISQINDGSKRFIGASELKNTKGKTLIKHYIPFDRFGGQGDFLVEIMDTSKNVIHQDSFTVLKGIKTR